MKRLLIVGSDDFTVHAMRLALQYTTGVSLFGVIQSNGEVRSAVREARPDMVIVDGLTARSQALDSVADIRAEAESAVVLLIVDRLSAPDAARAMEAGAVVCLWPDATIPAASDADAPALRDVRPMRLAEEPPRPAHNPLTNRELETLRWVIEGHTNAWIARKLWVTEQTVKFHLTNIYRKLGVANRTEASHYALVNDLFRTPGRTVREVGMIDGDRDGVSSAGGHEDVLHRSGGA
jgi:DNA-binding NarL/FixJ family response regulator